MPRNQSKPPKNLAKAEVLLPLPALSAELASSATEPADLMTAIKTCNDRPQSHALLKNSLYHHIMTITYPEHKTLIDQLTPDFPNLGEHTIFWRTLTALRLYQGQLLRIHFEDQTLSNFMTNPITFGTPTEHQGSLEWLIRAKDPIAVTILLLHGANPAVGISMANKELPLRYAYFMYNVAIKENNEKDQSKLESIMAILVAFYRGTNDPLQDNDIQDYPGLTDFLTSKKFKEEVSKVKSFLNELEQEQTFRLACQTKPSLILKIFGKIDLLQLLEILTSKSLKINEDNLPKFLGVTFTADFLKRHINLWFPQYMKDYKFSDRDQAYLRESGKLLALLKISIEEDNYFLATALIKIMHDLQIELSIDERNTLVTTVLTTYRKYLLSVKREEATSDDLDNYPIFRLDIPKEITPETLQRYQKTLELQAEIVSAKDQLATAKSKFADLRIKHAETRKIPEEELKEAEENIAIAKNFLRVTYQNYRTHFLSTDTEQSSLITLSPDELALKFLTLFCDTLQPITHLSIDHWKLLREAPLFDTMLFKHCLQHRSQNTALGDFKGKLDITIYRAYKSFQENAQIPQAFKLLLGAANGLTANAFIGKMHQLIQQRFLTNQQAVNLALQLFQEVMVAQGISAMMTDTYFDDEKELIQTLKLAFYLWPGIIDAKLTEQHGDYFIHHTLARYNRIGLAEILVEWGCSVILTNEEGQVPHFILKNLAAQPTAQTGVSKEDLKRIKELETLCRDKAPDQQALRRNNFNTFYKFQCIEKLKEIYTGYKDLITSLAHKEQKIREIYDELAKEFSQPTSQARSIDSEILKKTLIKTFPKKDAATIGALDLASFDNMDNFSNHLETIKIWSAENNFSEEIPLFSPSDIEEFKEKNPELFVELSPPQDQTALEKLINEYRVNLNIEGKDFVFYLDEYFTVEDILNYLQTQIRSLKGATLNDLSQRLGILLEPDLKVECLTHLEVTDEDGQITKGHLVVRDLPAPEEAPQSDTPAKTEKTPGFFSNLFSRTPSKSSVGASAAQPQLPAASPNSKGNSF